MEEESRLTKFFGWLWSKIGWFFYTIKVALWNLVRPKHPKPHSETQETLRQQARRRRRGELLFIWGSLLIPIINFGIFFVYVNIFSIDIAFRHPKIMNSTDRSYIYDFTNFVNVIHEFKNPYSQIQESVRNTLLYFGVDFLIMLPLCYVVSYFLYKKIWGSTAFKYIYFLPSIISAVIMSSFFKYMNEADGLLTRLVSKIAGQELYLLANRKTALATLVLYGMWGGFGVNMLYFLANFNRIPIEILESAKLEGVGTWQEIRYLLFPLTWPFFSTLMFLRLTGIFGSGGATLLLTKGQFGTYDLPYFNYEMTTTGTGSGMDSQQSVTAALGWLTTLVQLPVALYFKHRADKVELIEY